MCVVPSLYNVVLLPVLCGCLLCLLLCKEEGSSPVSAITERRDMVLYDVPLSMSLLNFRMGTMLVNFHVWYYVGAQSSFQHAHAECESKRAYVF